MADDDDEHQADDDTAAGISLRELIATEEDEDQPRGERWHATDDNDDEAGYFSEIPPYIAPYLKSDERRVLATRQHPARLIGPAVAAVGGLAVAIAGNSLLYVDHRASIWPVRLLWLAYLVALAWAIIRWLVWRQWWFVVTGHRLMVVRGVVARHVDMLPISKLRDVHYDQSGTGHVLGYATFDCESIATDNALGRVDYLPYPEFLYTEVCKLIMPPDAKPGPGRRRPRVGE